jgi:hypothetical protein
MAMEAHTEPAEAHPEANEAHPGAVEAHPGAVKAHPGALHAHPGAYRLSLTPSIFILELFKLTLNLGGSPWKSGGSLWNFRKP